MNAPVSARALSRMKVHNLTILTLFGAVLCPPSRFKTTEDVALLSHACRRAPIHTPWVDLWLLRDSSCERAFLPGRALGNGASRKKF